VTDPELTPAEPAAKPGDAHKVAEESFLRWIGETILLVGLAFVLALGIKTFVVQPFLIPSGSMEPTLQIGDRVLVNKFIYRFTQPKQGDVVVFISPDDKATDFIKRVIAVGGQTVDISDGLVSVDGKRLSEPYVNRQVVDHYNLDKAVKIPQGQVWLMGDNRTNSRDSRFFGPRPANELLGEAFVIYWPLGRIGTL
jgi:signal peptidase I